jgi:pimeloyl-ACP methyl ester carboxylesterase
MIPSKIYEFNPSSKKPVVHLAHANGFLPQTYKKALKPLLSDFKVVSLQIRPMWAGAEPNELRNWHLFADDLKQGLSDLSLTRVVGIGHSLGGVSTLYAAVKNQELFSHVILIDPTLLAPAVLSKIFWMKLVGLEARGSLVKSALRRRRFWTSQKDVYEYFKGRPLFKTWPENTVKEYAKSITRPAFGGGVELAYPPEWEARIYRTIPTDVWKFPQGLTQPTLVIRGENSNTFGKGSEEAFRRANPQAVIAVVKGAGHLVPQEKPEKVGVLITDFLKRDKS